MKKNILVLICLIPALFPRLDAAIAAPNDIMILGASDYSGQDDFLFINFAPIEAGEEVKFVNAGWTGSDFGSTTTPYTFVNETGSQIPVGTVTQSPVNSLALEFFFADQVFAYVGSDANPTPLFGLQNTDWGGAASGASDLPSTLINGVSAVDLNFGGSTGDHAVYTGGRNFASIAAAQASIADESNWTAGDNAATYDITPMTVPEPASLVLAALLGAACLLARGTRRLSRDRG